MDHFTPKMFSLSYAENTGLIYWEYFFLLMVPSATWEYLHDQQNWGVLVFLSSFPWKINISWFYFNHCINITVRQISKLFFLLYSPINSYEKILYLPLLGDNNSVGKQDINNHTRSSTSMFHGLCNVPSCEIITTISILEQTYWTPGLF